MHQKTEQGTHTDILLNLNPYNYVLYISKKLYSLTLSSETSWLALHWWPTWEGPFLLSKLCRNLDEPVLIHLDESTHWRFVHHQFGTICGNDNFTLRFESVVPFNPKVQMEFNMPPDSTALALQIQTLTANVEELTRQNQEMRSQLQQEENHSPTRTGMNRNDDRESHRRDDHRRPNTFDEANLDLLREMRREMDKLRNAMREKMDQNLDGMVRRTDSPFTMKDLECPMPPKFRLPQL